MDPNPNNNYKTKKKFTGSYTEVNLLFCNSLVSYIYWLYIIACQKYSVD